MLSILIVEDEHHLRVFLNESLFKRGYKVTLASTETDYTIPTSTDDIN